MQQQLKSQASADEQHRNWCDAQLVETRRQLSMKESKCARLTTKADALQQQLEETTEALKALQGEAEGLATTDRALQTVAATTRDEVQKWAQTHTVQLQIVRQATAVLERYNGALAAQRSSARFMQADVAPVSAASMEALAQLQGEVEGMTQLAEMGASSSMKD